MAIICEKKEIVLNFKKEKPTMYKISAVRQQQVSFEKLLDEVSSSCGVGRAPAKASVEALLDRMALFLDYGMSVKLGDFGTFKTVINVKSQENIEDVNAGTVTRKKIRFIPGKRFKTMLNDLSIMTMDDSNSSAKLPDEGGNGSGGDDDDDIVDPGT